MGAGGCSLQEGMVRSGLEKGMTFDYLEIQSSQVSRCPGIVLI